MARSYEPTDPCALDVLDSADIVRDAIFRQLSFGDSSNSTAFIDLPVSST
jgi:hypothetical protein